MLINTRILLLIASARDRYTSETMVHMQLLLMAAVLALDSDPGGSDGGPASIGNDTRNYNQLSNEVALQVSEHAWVLITVNLHLELWC